jgi:hypothetical protein
VVLSTTPPVPTAQPVLASSKEIDIIELPWGEGLAQVQLPLPVFSPAEAAGAKIMMARGIASAITASPVLMESSLLIIFFLLVDGFAGRHS